MNVHFLSLVTGVALAILPFAATAETVAYYRFDGTNGSPVTTILDSGPLGLNGTEVGAAKYSPGVIGTGLDLSGDGNFGSIPHSTNFVMMNDFTVELFFKANQPYVVYGSDGSSLINQLHTGFGGNHLSSYSIEMTASGSLNGFVSYALNVGLDTGLTSPSFADGRWHHMALVFRHNLLADINTLQLYVDYALQTAGSGAATPVAWADFPLYLGAGNYLGSDSQYRRNFDGNLDEVRISNVALLPSQFVTIPANQFALVQISNSIGGIQLQWDSRTNHAYQAQFTRELPANPWTNLGGPLSGKGNPLTLHDAFVPEQTQRFFRVLEAP